MTKSCLNGAGLVLKVPSIASTSVLLIISSPWSVAKTAILFLELAFGGPKYLKYKFYIIKYCYFFFTKVEVTNYYASQIIKRIKY